MGRTELTRKQQAVCDLVVLGFTSKEIGTRLGISHRTVESHREAVFDKLGVQNAVELTRVTMGIEE